MSPNERSNEDFSDIEVMLPWYAAGTLEPQETARIEAELADNPALQQQLELINEEIEQDIRLNTALGAPSTDILPKLMARIAAEPSHLPAALSLKMKFSGWVEDFIGSISPVRLGVTAAIAVLMICIQAVILAGIYFQSPQDSIYQSASDATARPVQTGTNVLIAFQPQATAMQITRFLESNQLQILNGPRPGGFFTIRLDAGKLAPAALKRRLETLRASDRIVRLVMISG
ncbi:MAG TPA: hypothetical protein ENJ57_08205 [Rhizobiales bacterium]|nr:hypothetical protein [Hyphomicrobiales bacterium]